MEWKLTYEMAPAPPPAVPWEEYEKRAKGAWQKLLRSEAAKDENAIHAFLEQHPRIGHYSSPGLRSCDRAPSRRGGSVSQD